jgi:hypothetical protein
MATLWPEQLLCIAHFSVRYDRRAASIPAIALIFARRFPAL